MVDLRKHSSRHLETKVVLPIPEVKAYEREIRYYVFSPPQLYVNKTTYPEPRMLQKFQCHGRYASPEITLEELIDEHNELSPLMQLKDYTENLEKDITSIPERNIINILQTIVNSLRHENKVCLQDCKDMIRLGMVKELRATLENWYRDINTLKDAVRSQLVQIRTTFPPGSRVLLAYLWADEAISILEEQEALDLYMACAPLNSQFPVILPKLMVFSREEANYRIHEQYQSGSSNPETVQYRKAVLKKWTQSALYLVPEISRWPLRVSQILAGTAAGIAMTFATLASIFAENAFIKNSLQWALIVIIAYVFKDRIKEWLRTFFNAVLPKMMADEISSFNSPKNGTRICSSRIKLTYLDISEIPKRVKDIRRDKNNPFADMLPKENILCYVRNLTMHPPGKKESTPGSFPRENNFTLVTRIRLDDFLKEMDDPNDIVFRMDPNADELDQLNSERVYHLHLVIYECSAKEDIDLYSHYCVVLNKSGIVRIEQLPDA
jgi:hypothetical protein